MPISMLEQPTRLAAASAKAAPLKPAFSLFFIYLPWFVYVPNGHIILSVDQGPKDVLASTCISGPV